MRKGVVKVPPLLKWTGGKYDEYKKFKNHIPSFTRYYEPFFGGGGIFFAVQPKGKCYLNDVSHDLIQFYTQLRNSQFQKELWQYVRAWEQSETLAKDVALLLLPVVERYLAGKVEVTQFGEEVRRCIQTIRYSSYKPLFQPCFFIDVNRYLNHLQHCVKDKCRRLKKRASKEQETIAKEQIVRHIETAVQSAFYVQVRYLHNTYAAKIKNHH